jgi:hypothetical protein
VPGRSFVVADESLHRPALHRRSFIDEDVQQLQLTPILTSDRRAHREMEGRVELMLQVRHCGALRSIDDGLRNRPDVRRQLASPNRILGDEPEQVGILEEPVERSPDLTAHPVTGRGQTLADELGVLLEQALQCRDITRIDGRYRLTKEGVEIDVGHVAGILDRKPLATDK